LRIAIKTGACERLFLPLNPLSFLVRLVKVPLIAASFRRIVMNKWRHTPKAGMYSIAQVQTYVVKALQGIRQWCQQPIGNWSNGRSLWSFVCLFLVGVSLSVTEYTTQVYKNAPVLTKDAREASDLFFQQNQGDVLIN
jgi:type II secretory pathway component PulL